MDTLQQSPGVSGNPGQARGQPSSASTSGVQPQPCVGAPVQSPLTGGVRMQATNPSLATQSSLIAPGLTAQTPVSQPQYLPTSSLQRSPAQTSQSQVMSLLVNQPSGEGQLRYHTAALQGLVPNSQGLNLQHQFRPHFQPPVQSSGQPQQALYSATPPALGGMPLQNPLTMPPGSAGLQASMSQGRPPARLPQIRPGQSYMGMTGTPSMGGAGMLQGGGGPGMQQGGLQQIRPIGTTGSMQAQGWGNPRSIPMMAPQQPIRGPAPAMTPATSASRPTYISAQAPGTSSQPTSSSAYRKPGQRPVKPPQPLGGKKHCNCKNSRCLKLYCECFASGRYCDNCNCVSCCNNKENETFRQSAVETILDRNPNAFRPKIQEREGAAAAAHPARHNKGCNCKKSGCLKKYCECFQASIFCSDICKCVDCKNYNTALGPKGSIPTQPRTKTIKVDEMATPGSTAPSPGSFTAALNEAMAGDASQPLGTRALKESLHELANRKGFEEMAALLFLVADEEADKLEIESRPSVAVDSTSVRLTDANGDTEMATPADAHPSSLQPGELSTAAGPSTSASAPPETASNGAAAMYAVKEHAMLQEYQLFLDKLVQTVSKKMADYKASDAQQATTIKPLDNRAQAPPQEVHRPASSTPYAPASTDGLQSSWQIPLSSTARPPSGGASLASTSLPPSIQPQIQMGSLPVFNHNTAKAEAGIGPQAEPFDMLTDENIASFGDIAVALNRNHGT